MQQTYQFLSDNFLAEFKEICSDNKYNLKKLIANDHLYKQLHVFSIASTCNGKSFYEGGISFLFYINNYFNMLFLQYNHFIWNTVKDWLLYFLKTAKKGV